MKIGIIGTGAIGGTIAKKLAVAGHTVKVYSSQEQDSLGKRAQELGVSPSTRDEITKDVDVVIISVPTTAMPQLPGDLFADMPDHVILVDTSNYYPFRDGEIEGLENGKVESVWVAETLGHPVVKAFNNLLAETLTNGGTAPGTPGRIAMAIAGDDDRAKQVVATLGNDAGFDVVDSGSLSESWRQQPGTPAYCTELNVAELTQALADGDKEEAPQRRDFAIKTLMERTTQPSHDEILVLNRSLSPTNPKQD